MNFIHTWRTWILAGVLLMSADITFAAGELKVGLESEFSLVLFLFRLVFAICAIMLLIAGCRLPRFTAGIFSLLIALLLAWELLSPINYLLMLLVVLLIFSILMWLFIRLRRVFMAFVMIFPPVLLYGFWLFSRGDFDLNKVLVAGMAGASLIIGAAFPALSLSIVAPVLGCALGNIALPAEVPLWVMAIVWSLTTLWQFYLWFKSRIRMEQSPDIENIRDSRWKAWKKSVRVGGITLLFAFLIIVFLSPQPASLTPEGSKRISHLKSSGALKRPGFIFSGNDGFYLFGKPYPVALIGKHDNVLDRLTALILGHNLTRTVHDMRTVKDTFEIERMRKAGTITTQAMKEAASLIKPGVNESDLEQAILESYRKQGATGVAFKSLVGSGKNTLLPHYSNNNAILKDGFIVIDMGCMVDGYSMDMTRTFPVNGVYSPAQRRLMDIVLEAKKKSVAALKPGVTMKDMDKIARDLIKKAGFGPYFTHSLGHHVGINVHDAESNILKEGMVVTIEPGIYVPEGSSVDRSYWNLGLRMEDTYLITKNGSEPFTGVTD